MMIPQFTPQSPTMSAVNRAAQVIVLKLNVLSYSLDSRAFVCWYEVNVSQIGYQASVSPLVRIVRNFARILSTHDGRGGGFNFATMSLFCAVKTARSCVCAQIVNFGSKAVNQHLLRASSPE